LPPSPPPSSSSPFSLIQQLPSLLLILCYSLSYISHKTHCLFSYNCSLPLLRLYINLTLFINIYDFE
jgi:hypothetical protein